MSRGTLGSWNWNRAALEFLSAPEEIQCSDLVVVMGIHPHQRKSKLPFLQEMRQIWPVARDTSALDVLGRDFRRRSVRRA